MSARASCQAMDRGRSFSIHLFWYEDFSEFPRCGSRSGLYIPRSGQRIAALLRDRRVDEGAVAIRYTATGSKAQLRLPKPTTVYMRTVATLGVAFAGIQHSIIKPLHLTAIRGFLYSHIRWHTVLRDRLHVYGLALVVFALEQPPSSAPLHSFVRRTNVVCSRQNCVLGVFT